MAGYLNDGLGDRGEPTPSLGPMSLARHAVLLWRYRAVAATGLLLGAALAFLATYKVTFDGGPSLVARGSYAYTSESSLLVTQEGFPEGRVVLPSGQNAAIAA